MKNNLPFGRCPFHNSSHHCVVLVFLLCTPVRSSVCFSFSYSSQLFLHTHNSQHCHTHTQLSHTQQLFHTQLCHPHTRTFHTLSHTHTTLSHTTLSHITLSNTPTQPHTHARTHAGHNIVTHNNSFFTHNFVTHLVTGVAFGDIDAHFAWQVWYLRHWAAPGGALGRCCARCGT